MLKPSKTWLQGQEKFSSWLKSYPFPGPISSAESSCKILRLWLFPWLGNPYGGFRAKQSLISDFYHLLISVLPLFCFLFSIHVLCSSFRILWTQVKQWSFSSQSQFLRSPERQFQLESCSPEGLNGPCPAQSPWFRVSRARKILPVSQLWCLWTNMKNSPRSQTSISLSQQINNWNI